MSLPMLGSTRAFSTTAAVLKVKTERQTVGLTELGIFSSSVAASTAVMFSLAIPQTSVNRNAGDLLMSMARPHENTKSSAVTGLPLANLAAGFSLKVNFHISPSSATSHVSARTGINSPAPPGVNETNVS